SVCLGRGAVAALHRAPAQCGQFSVHDELSSRDPGWLECGHTVHGVVPGDVPADGTREHGTGSGACEWLSQVCGAGARDVGVGGSAELLAGAIERVDAYAFAARAAGD